MADIYLSSVDGSDSDDGSTWALAKATLAAALTAAGAGGRVFMDNSHSESTAGTINITSPGTADAWCQILCVDRTGDPEPPTALATTGVVATTGNTFINFAGFAVCYGVTFTGQAAGVNGRPNFVSASPWAWRFIDSAIKMPGTLSTVVSFGTNSTAVDDQLLELYNTVLQIGASASLDVRCRMRWFNTPNAIVGTPPTTLFAGAHSGPPCDVLLSGVDLSAYDSGKNLVNVANLRSDKFRFINCKLGSSVSVSTGTHPGQGGTEITLVNCDSADTNYRYYHQTYQGTITQESTIVRTGGASDGTTPISRKMVSSANSKLYSPLVLDGIVIWNEAVGGALTATVEVVTDNVTLTDKEAWLEVEYLGTSGFPVSSLAHDRASDNNAFLGSGANQTSSSETWTTTGLTTPVKQALAVTFTPQEKGPIRFRVMLAKASTTMYVCPKVGVA